MTTSEESLLASSNHGRGYHMANEHARGGIEAIEHSRRKLIFVRNDSDNNYLTLMPNNKGINPFMRVES